MEISSMAGQTIQRVPVHDNHSRLIQSRVRYFASKKRPLAFTLSARANMSNSGCNVGNKEKEEQFLEVERPGPQDNNTEMEKSATCTTVRAEEKPVQGTACADSVDEKTMEICPGVPDGNTSEQTRSAPSSKKPSQSPQVSQLSKRAQRKLLRKEKLKEQRKAKRSGNLTNNSSPGFDSELFGQTDYYFENGLRKVYPYHYTFSTYAKERWYGRTLQDIMEMEFRVDSPDNVKTSMAKGLMRVNGKVAKMDHIIRNGDLIEHDIHRHENPVTGKPIEILEDTEDVVVINKPASIPCHPCGKFRFNSIVFIMGKELGYANLRNIYRLDRLTSGVLILGKTARKTKELENHVLHRRVHKEYVARVVGEFPPEEITVDKPLDCLSHKLTLWRVVEKGGKPSRTTFQRLSYNGQTSLVKCIPHTGRTHQIRVHLQFLGHPIVNDPYYNSSAWGPQRGKGSHCDVSFEELCQRIMKEHNVGLWCDGENPLFSQRLAETRLSQQPPHRTEDKTAMQEDNSNNTDTRPVMEEEGSGDSSYQPPAKRLCRDSSLSPLPAESCVGSDPVNPASVNPDPVNPASVNPAPDTCVDITPEVHVCPETGVSCAPKRGENSDDGNEKPASEGCNLMAAEEAGGCAVRKGMVEQKGFDPQRWVPDSNCESCRLKYIDPKPTDLLLYLHALRYKGPGWDYRTKLPDWAADDWQEPEEYKKYLQ
ncbi:pseudouridylate synthase RPUSD2-like isoform X2 [Babylonia areolata]|uniref:pseudouridylate synthase RPUSD2-like isoform X2 n=1 Tax=Babylonia areolata TaxID=304850 RepID=UPI003FD00781